MKFRKTRWLIAFLTVAVIVAVPAPFAVTTPPYTVATLPFEVDHTTVLSVAFDGFTVTTSVPVPPTESESVFLSRETLSTGTVCVETV